MFNTPGRYFVKSPHCLEKTSSLKRISNAKFSSSFLSSRRPCFSQNSFLPAFSLFLRTPVFSRRFFLFSAPPNALCSPIFSLKPFCLPAALDFPAPTFFLVVTFAFSLSLFSCRPASRRPCSLAPLFFLVAALVSSPRKIYFFFYRVKDKKRNPRRPFLPARRKKVSRISAVAAARSPIFFGKNPAYPPQKGFVPILPSYRRAYTF